MIDLASGEDIEDSTGTFCVDSTSVGQGVSYHQMLGGDPVTVVWVLEDSLNQPLRAGPTLTEPTAGERQTGQPVTLGWDLLWAGQPPPLTTKDLVDDVIRLGSQPCPTFRLRKSGTTLSQ